MATIAATCEFEEQCLASRESSNGGIIRSSPIPPTNGGKVIAFWKFECSTRDILSQLLQLAWSPSREVESHTVSQTTILTIQYTQFQYINHKETNTFQIRKKWVYWTETVFCTRDTNGNPQLLLSNVQHTRCRSGGHTAGTCSDPDRNRSGKWQ